MQGPQVKIRKRIKRSNRVGSSRQPCWIVTGSGCDRRQEHPSRTGIISEISRLVLSTGYRHSLPMMRLLLCLPLLLIAASARCDFILFDSEKDITPAPIILFEKAPPYTRQAAVELADYLEKVGGVRPELIEGTPDPVPNRAVWVGYQPVVKSLFPKVDFDFKHSEEILIAATDDHLVIAGRDRWDPDHLEVEGINEKIIGVQQEYGTVNAVYTFLQDYLDIRWLWPGELGEDVPVQKRVAFKPFEFRFHPDILARGGALNYSVLSNKGYGKAHKWARLQRLQLGSLGIGGGHGFGDWWERYHEKHPEIFALQPDGTRNGHPSPRNAKLCQSNPKVWELWLEGVKEQLEKDPTRTVFNGSPNDGWSSGHCTCDQCRAWDHPEGEPRLFHWHHYREERPAISDRHVTFANHLAGLLKKTYPDKEYFVMMLAYGHSRPAPVKARPAENVIMVSVANFYGRTGLVDRGSTWGTTHRDQFAAWGKLAHHLMWRPNTGSPAGWQQGLPDVSIHQTIKDIKFMHANHGRGIYIDAVWEHWATQGPQFYVMTQLLWDPEKDGQAILDDYYKRAFGPAAEDIEAYFDTFEKPRMAFVEKYNFNTERRHFPDLYTDELLASAGDHLKAAAAKTNGAPEIFGKRVAFIQAGLDYTKLSVENIAAMETYWDSPDEAVATKVRENWKEIERICEANPYAINWGPVRPITPRMAGLHPDHPDPKRKKSKPSKKAPNDLDQN